MKKLAILCCLFSLTISTAQSQLLEESNFTSFWDGRIQTLEEQAGLTADRVLDVKTQRVQGGARFPAGGQRRSRAR